MTRFSPRYTLLTYRPDQLWLPAAFWVLFAVVSLFLGGGTRRLDMARAYLGTVVPLVSGVLAAYALLDDPALELRFAAPTRAERLLLERLGLIFLVSLVCAAGFQLYSLALGVDFALLGDGIDLQMAWLVPTVSLMALGCAASLAGRATTTGVSAAGMVWLAELLARGWLARTEGRYVLLFMGALMPEHPALIANRICLLGISCGLLLASAALLRRQERYI
jgi:hypothetical protein